MITTYSKLQTSSSKTGNKQIADTKKTGLLQIAKTKQADFIHKTDRYQTGIKQVSNSYQTLKNSSQTDNKQRKTVKNSCRTVSKHPTNREWHKSDKSQTAFKQSSSTTNQPRRCPLYLWGSWFRSILLSDSWPTYRLQRKYSLGCG